MSKSTGATSGSDISHRSRDALSIIHRGWPTGWPLFCAQIFWRTALTPGGLGAIATITTIPSFQPFDRCSRCVCASLLPFHHSYHSIVTTIPPFQSFHRCNRSIIPPLPPLHHSYHSIVPIVLSKAPGACYESPTINPSMCTVLPLTPADAKVGTVFFDTLTLMRVNKKG